MWDVKTARYQYEMKDAKSFISTMWDVKKYYSSEKSRLKKSFISTMWDVKRIGNSSDSPGDFVLSRLCGM